MKVVLLDFNGTLFFDTGFHEEAWAKIYRELNENTDNEPDRSFYAGPRNDVIIQRMAPWLKEEERLKVSRHKEEIYRKICKENPEQVQLVPGAEEFLTGLKERKIPYILASASIKENIDFYFETFQLGRWLSKEECVYDNGSYADKGEMHKEAAKRLGARMEDCIVIEDSITAIRHAKENKAGCIIAIGSSKVKEQFMELGADHFISDFTEIDFSWFEG